LGEQLNLVSGNWSLVFLEKANGFKVWRFFVYLPIGYVKPFDVWACLLHTLCSVFSCRILSDLNSMLAQRIATAIVLLLVIGGALVMGHRVFAVVAALLLSVGIYEWLRLVGHRWWIAVVCALVMGGVLWGLEILRVVPSYVYLSAAWFALMIWCAMGVILYAVERGGAGMSTVLLNQWPGSALCLLLIGAAWFALMALSRAGAGFLLSALAVVWVADIAAYFAGRAFGKRKLAPRISPGKTWAGVVGAMVAVLGLALLAAFLWPQAPLYTTILIERASFWVAALVLCGLVALSIVGDLFESMLKRHAGVKDSGMLLPGHGGVLDRIDALLPVLPALLLVSEWLRI